MNRRETAHAPTKAGVIGMLAAAQGLRRGDSIASLLKLTMGVRVDKSGSMLRDYHTVSDYRGRPLLSSSVDAKGRQRPTASKMTGVTERFYLQDAVFVAAVRGDRPFMENLAAAMRRPSFPLALGRRSCVPTQPLVLSSDGAGDLWAAPIVEVLCQVPWQGSPRRAYEAKSVGQTEIGRQDTVRLAAVVDAEEIGQGLEDEVQDVPTSFDQRQRGFTYRRVIHTWVEAPNPAGLQALSSDEPFGFALLERQ
jgi:CRISPR system Cascade subunit CasD